MLSQLDFMIVYYYICLMKKIELSKEEIKEVLRLYNEEILGSPSIAKKMGYHKTIILRTLKENNVIVGKSGRRYLGGKNEAQKRYESKPKVKNKRKKYHKKYRKDNKETIRKNHNKWREENREHVNEYGRNYERTRRANDAKYRLTARTRTAVYTCLKEASIVKYKSTFKILGYSIEKLMSHLEKQFTEDMTWDNYGEWHVDHKLPISSFEFDSTECDGFKECWKLENLQPLWKSDNLSKGSKLI